MNIVGKIDGVKYSYLQCHRDERGWLAELFRSDENTDIAMAHITYTKSNQVRGPREHKKQTDHIVFLDYFNVYLYDNRRRSNTYKVTMKILDEYGFILIIPPGVIHTYKRSPKHGFNGSGLIVNLPDQLYAGKYRKKSVDEIRYEKDPKCPLYTFL